MSNFQTIQFQIKDGVSWVTLNRPELRNAFNDQMIDELRNALEETEQNPETTALILQGSGPVFSTGADLNWMKQKSFQPN